MNQRLTNIDILRDKYMRNGLHRADLTIEPMILFEQWFQQACIAMLPDVNAMTVGTVDKNGQTYQRLVLLKHFDQSGMIFYTNLNSRKAYHLLSNPRISLHFPWHTLGRQVLALGEAKRLPLTDNIKYFYSRPKNSQISAWVSQQSKPISCRYILENKFQELKKVFKYKKISFPKFWGGYKVTIDAMEFWQNGQYRLHDRFLYQYKNGIWYIERLSP